MLLAMRILPVAMPLRFIKCVLCPAENVSNVPASKSQFI